MVLQPGTRDSDTDRPESLASVMTRGVGFLLLAGLALAVIAAVVLMPAYAGLNQVIVENERIAAANTYYRKHADARDQLIKDVANDRILAKRVAMQRFGSLPRTEYVVPGTEDPRAPQAGEVAVPPPPKPQPAENWMTATAAKLSHPTTRTVLLLAASASLAVAVFFTGASRRKRKALSAP